MEITKGSDYADIKELLKKTWENRKLILRVTSITILITAVINLFLPSLYLTHSEIRLALRNTSIFYARDIMCKEVLQQENLKRIFDLIDIDIPFDTFKRRMVIRPMYGNQDSIEIISWAKSPSKALEINERLVENFMGFQRKLVKDYISTEKARSLIDGSPGYQTIKKEIETTRLSLLEDLEQIRKMIKEQTGGIDKSDILTTDRSRLKDGCNAVEEKIGDFSSTIESDETKKQILNIKEARVIKRAQLPERPFRPKRLLNALLAGIGSFVLSIGYILLKNENLS